MKVHFSQIYIDPDAYFPFSCDFQRRLSEEVTALVHPSAKFIEKYGGGFELTFNVSAKNAIQDNEIKGPAVFRKTKDVEYSIFLPFDLIVGRSDAPRSALTFLLRGVCDVFDLLEIEKVKLLEKEDSLIDGICSDPKTLAEPSWDEERNKGPVNIIFQEFFKKNRRRKGRRK